MAEPTDSLVGRLEIAPVLAGVTHGGVSELISHGKLKTFKPGEVVFREGEYGFEFYVVLAGSVVVIKTTPTGGDEHIETIGIQGFFGEMGPMLGQPRSATIIADEDCTLLEIGEHDFNHLIQEIPSFKATMDQAYLERALSLCLALVPLFRALSHEERVLLASKVELVTLEKGESVFREGETAEAFYLVRRGFVKVTKQIDGRTKVLAYIRENGWFGEMALLEGRPRQASVTALGPVELVRIDANTFDGLFRHHSDLRLRIRETMKERRARDEHLEESEDMAWAMLVERGIIQLHDVLAIDLNACTRCGFCEDRCAQAHGGFARLVRKGFRVQTLLIPASCHMCPDPECMKACRFGVITRDRDGAVTFRDHCTGCQKCVGACPYGVISVAEIPAKNHRKRRMAVKCDRCRGLGMHACVVDCPTGALRWVDPQRLVT